MSEATEAIYEERREGTFWQKEPGQWVKLCNFRAWIVEKFITVNTIYKDQTYTTTDTPTNGHLFLEVIVWPDQEAQRVDIDQKRFFSLRWVDDELKPIPTAIIEVGPEINDRLRHAIKTLSAERITREKLKAQRDTEIREQRARDAEREREMIERARVNALRRKAWREREKPVESLPCFQGTSGVPKWRWDHFRTILEEKGVRTVGDLCLAPKATLETVDGLKPNLKRLQENMVTGGYWELTLGYAAGWRVCWIKD